MPETTVNNGVDAAEPGGLYDGRTRKENLNVTVERIKTRPARARFISGFLEEEDALAPQGTAGSRREED